MAIKVLQPHLNCNLSEPVLSTIKLDNLISIDYCFYCDNSKFLVTNTKHTGVLVCIPLREQFYSCKLFFAVIKTMM